MNQLDIFQSKEDALLALEIARKEYLVRARVVAERLSKRLSCRFGVRALVTVDNVRAYCPPPQDIDPRVMGAIFNTPDWEATGYIKSTRKTCHGRPIAQFRYVGS